MNRRASRSRRGGSPQAAASNPGLHDGERQPVLIVPLDGSVEAKAALPAARLAAHIVGGSIHLVHVAEQRMAPEEILRRMRVTREETRGTVVELAVGFPPDEIVRVAEVQRALVIVMTTRGHTHYLGRVVRPVVEQVMRSAPCPVLLVRPEIVGRVESMDRIRRILLPLDGAPSTAAVIDVAMEIARYSDAKVDILYVAGTTGRPAECGTLTTPRYLDQPQHEWPSWTREFISRSFTYVAGHAAQVPRRLFVRSGDPAAEILRFADEHESDLIVLEWRGQLDADRAKTMQAILAEAPCLVLLLRTDTSPRSRSSRSSP